MNPNLEEIWVYLSTSPLLGLTLTLLAYQAAFWIYKRVGFHPLANPVLISVAILASRHPCLGPRPSSAALPAWSGGSQEGVRNQSCVRMRGILSPIGL